MQHLQWLPTGEESAGQAGRLPGVTLLELQRTCVSKRRFHLIRAEPERQGAVLSHGHGCTCMYLDEQLGGIEPLLLRCCGVLSSQYRLHNVRYRIAGALHCVRMPCRRPWTPTLWELPHDRHVHIEVDNM